MNSEVTAYDWILRVIDKAPWPGDMEPSWEFQKNLAHYIENQLRHTGHLKEEE